VYITTWILKDIWLIIFFLCFSACWCIRCNPWNRMCVSKQVGFSCLRMLPQQTRGHTQCISICKDVCASNHRRFPKIVAPWQHCIPETWRISPQQVSSQKFESFWSCRLGWSNLIHCFDSMQEKCMPYRLQPATMKKVDGKGHVLCMINCVKVNKNSILSAWLRHKNTQSWKC